MIKLSKKELEEFVENTKNSESSAEIRSFYESLAQGEKPTKRELSNLEMREEEAKALWDDQRARLLFNFRWLATSQGLQFHPRISYYYFVHSTVNRGGHCILNNDQFCPCLDPLGNGCPLFIKRRLLLGSGEH